MQKKLFFIILMIALLPSYVFAGVLQPYDTYMSAKATYPEFGDRPWEQNKISDFNSQKKVILKNCKEKQKILEKQNKIEELKIKAEKSLKDMEVPQIDDYKTWMSYTSVTSTGSPQYQLLNSNKAYTDKNNFRKIGEYYCVALGSFYSTEIGTRFRITFDNGQSIKVILGDQKSDRHTDSKHQFSSSGNILEFIMGSKEYSNQAMINTLYPSGVKKIQKYTNEEDLGI